jgi:hypothetical protein
VPAAKDRLQFLYQKPELFMHTLSPDELRVRHNGFVIVHSLEARRPHLDDGFIVLRENHDGCLIVEHHGRPSEVQFNGEAAAFLRAMSRAKAWIDANMSPSIESNPVFPG